MDLGKAQWRECQSQDDVWAAAWSPVWWFLGGQPWRVLIPAKETASAKTQGSEQVWPTLESMLLDVTGVEGLCGNTGIGGAGGVSRRQVMHAYAFSLPCGGHLLRWFAKKLEQGGLCLPACHRSPEPDFDISFRITGHKPLVANETNLMLSNHIFKK